MFLAAVFVLRNIHWEEDSSLYLQHVSELLSYSNVPAE